eukprot:COSAG01_NODE_1624_length_9704_cov_186.948777_10_plen_56_part_00
MFRECSQVTCSLRHRAEDEDGEENEGEGGARLDGHYLGVGRREKKRGPTLSGAPA